MNYVYLIPHDDNIRFCVSDFHHCRNLPIITADLRDKILPQKANRIPREAVRFLKR